ncbi:MAG: patatin-like phospholipase family protein [Tissierella sp.]|nr:patatin-like phospholipase family protein [Tissierella sp.]
MIGLVLEGGGARGSYHVGAYKAILEEGIKIDGITGTSIGGLNAAMIIQGDFDICCDLWENISYSMVINTNDEEIEHLRQLKLNKEDLKTLVEKLKIIIGERGFDITPFKELLDTYIDEDKIRNSPIDFGLVTVNLTDFKAHEVFKEDIPYGSLKDYLLASAYLPVFKSEKLGGKVFLDGGFYDNLPFKMLQNKGYDKLILVRTHARGFTRKIDKANQDITVISPSDDIGRTYTFEADTCKRNMELGYYDALRALRNLKGQKYYVLPNEDKNFYFDLLLSLEDKQIKEIRKLMHISDNIPDKRVLLETIVPKLGSVLGLNKDFTYEDLLVGLLDKKAEVLEIERFKIYSFDELLALVKNTKLPMRPKNVEELSAFERMIEKVAFASLFNKEDGLLKISDIIFGI